MEWDAFHAKAKSARPLEELSARRYHVGILCHDTPAVDTFEQEDFLWIRAHSKVTFKKIKEQYRVRHPEVDFVLQFKEPLSDDAVVKDLDHYNDSLIVFKAQRRQARTPLQPVHGQSTVEAPGLVFAGSATPNTQQLFPIKTESAREAGDGGTTPRTPVSADKENASPRHTFAPSICSTSDPIKEEKSSRTPPEIMSNMTGPEALPQPIRNTPLSQTPPPRTPLPRTSIPPPPLPQTPLPQAPLPQAPRPQAVQPSPAPSSARSDALSSVQPKLQAPLPVTPTSNTFSAIDAHPSMAQSEEAAPAQSFERSSNVPFDPDEVFNKDDSPEVEERHTDVHLRQLIDQKKPEVLEAGVEKALKILESLGSTFSSYARSSPDADAWLKAIAKLREQAVRKRTVVGVVGNTGAGKSSVINAMLDEERLVPTNCMRACTAVVTELSWNDSEEPGSKYRAEIEFITQSDWEKELKLLLTECITENGTISRETADQNSDAGIAYAKFHAVYPRITKETLLQCTVERLMEDRAVLDVLGKTKKINKPQPEAFYRELQRYVDSKEKATVKKKGEKKQPFQMEFWPLIKVVKIYTKSPALSTGAVIVDLPGVHDSNAARAAVAQGYLKQCTGLWIVAPITRAVDDKAAKTLLGDTFKRQLKYDGGFSNVTFICSKTDDISITEATDSLGLEENISGLDDQERGLKAQVEGLQEKIADLQETKETLNLALNSAEEDIETWEALRDQLDEGKVVFAPAQKENKRKRGASKSKDRKRPRQDEDASDDDSIVDDNDSEASQSETEDEDEAIQAPRTPLTEEDIKSKLEEFKTSKKTARRQRLGLEEQVIDVKAEVQNIQAKLADVRAQMNAICIAGRNEYSKGAIQLDYAAGIKELDMENAIEEDEENFDPEKDLRDYDEVARSLPVFCVSSRAYQKMCGRLQKDENVPGFKTKEETEIPELQAHCKKLTEAGRIQASRSFLLNFCQQLTTFSFWASNTGSGLKLTDDEKRKQVLYLEKRLGELEKGLEKATEKCISAAKDVMTEQIFDKFPSLIEEAVKAAPETSSRWGAHKMQGGLYYSTYKAIVRRAGTYTSKSAGFRDFNCELADPIIKKLATGWERAFQHRLPKCFQTYTTESSKILHAFHEKVEERARQNGAGLANLAALKNQIYAYEQLFADLYSHLITAMNEMQRNANREFTPTIVYLMQNAYDLATYEAGPGSFMRMKAHMANHVDHARHHMFTAATQTVRDHLKQMCKDLEDAMATRAYQIFMGMQRDYMQVLGGRQIVEGEEMSKEDRVMRAEVEALLMGIDEQFKTLANAELKSDPPNDEDMFVTEGDQKAEDEEEDEDEARKPFYDEEEHSEGRYDVKMEQTEDDVQEDPSFEPKKEVEEQEW